MHPSFNRLRSVLQGLWRWCAHSGLSAGGEALAFESLRTVVPIGTIVCGLIAAAGALIHIVFLEPGFRPWLLAGHCAFIAMGIAWYLRPPTRLNVATAIAVLYLSSVIGIYMLNGGFDSALHFGILIVGAMYLVLDRRLLLVSLAIWATWLVAVSLAWLPQGKGLSMLVIALIASAGGAVMRHIRKTSVEALVSMQNALEKTIAEREAAVQRAQQAEKLESLGVMAAGVAHDYNNLLVGVVGGVDLALYAKTEKERMQALETVKSFTDALRGLSKQLLEVAGGRPILKRDVDLNRVVERTVHLLCENEQRSSRIRCVLEPSLPPVRGELQSLGQVVFNLLSNAIAFASDRTGAIEMGTCTTSAGKAPQQILLWVEDDGPGVPDALVSRIFDPFFSTLGSHRGLGLATVRTIVSRHEGSVSVKPGRAGARFEVRLPPHQPEMHSETMQHDPHSSTAAI